MTEEVEGGARAAVDEVADENYGGDADAVLELADDEEANNEEEQVAPPRKDEPAGNEDPATDAHAAEAEGEKCEEDSPVPVQEQQIEAAPVEDMEEVFEEPQEEEAAEEEEEEEPVETEETDTAADVVYPVEVCEANTEEEKQNATAAAANAAKDTVVVVEEEEAEPLRTCDDDEDDVTERSIPREATEEEVDDEEDEEKRPSDDEQPPTEEEAVEEEVAAVLPADEPEMKDEAPQESQSPDHPNGEESDDEASRLAEGSKSLPCSPNKQNSRRKVARSSSFGKGLSKRLKKIVRRNSKGKKDEAPEAEDEAIPSAAPPSEDVPEETVSDAPPSNVVSEDTLEDAAPSEEGSEEQEEEQQQPPAEKKGLKKLVRRMSFGKGKSQRNNGGDTPSSKSIDTASVDGSSQRQMESFDAGAPAEESAPSSEDPKEKKGLKKLIRRMSFGKGQLSSDAECSDNEKDAPASEQPPVEEKSGPKKLVRRMSFGKGQRKKPASTSSETSIGEPTPSEEKGGNKGIKRIIRRKSSGGKKEKQTPSSEKTATTRGSQTTETKTTTSTTVVSTSTTILPSETQEVKVTTTTRTEEVKVLLPPPTKVATCSPKKEVAKVLPPAEPLSRTKQVEVKKVAPPAATSPRTVNKPIASPTPADPVSDNVQIEKVFYSEKDQAKPIGWKKPEWTQKPVLKNTDKGVAVKHGESLANPITFPVGKGDGVNKKVQPDEVLKYKGGPDVEEERDLSWKKPSWVTNSPLKKTNKGAALKSGAEIHRPIGGIKALDEL